MIFIDLYNKNKSYCKNIIDLLNKNDADIIVNCNYINYTKDNVKVINTTDERELADYAIKSEMVLIFDINDYKKYVNYCKRIIMVLDSKNNKLSRDINKLCIEFSEINDINNIIRMEKSKKKNKKSNMDLFLYFILITIIFSLSLLSIRKSETVNNLNNEKKNLSDSITDLRKINKNYTNYLFLGDSITDYYDLDKYYEGYKVVNSGISGNQTSDILDDLQKRAYVYNPSTIFLLIGTNDYIHNKKEDETVNNIKEIVEKLNKNLPNAKIYLESIYPVNNTDDKKISKPMVSIRNNTSIKKINSELKKYCNDKNCTYLDMYSLLEDKDGNLKLEYTKEGLHMTDKGYEVITKELKKYMHK